MRPNGAPWKPPRWLYEHIADSEWSLWGCLGGALLEPLGVPWGPKRVPGAISGALGPSVCALGDPKGPKKRQAENL